MPRTKAFSVQFEGPPELVCCRQPTIKKIIAVECEKDALALARTRAQWVQFSRRLLFTGYHRTISRDQETCDINSFSFKHNKFCARVWLLFYIHSGASAANQLVTPKRCNEKCRQGEPAVDGCLEVVSMHVETTWKETAFCSFMSNGEESHQSTQHNSIVCDIIASWNWIAGEII